MSANKQSRLQAVRGMNDLLPANSDVWQRVEQACIGVLAGRGYSEIRTPIVENTQLFARSIGADTDIVAKEMYTFVDRNDDSLTLRPEGTASCARAGVEHGLFYNQQQRLWYYGPMFRHERPQKGRYRQFHQLGAEAYGWTTPDIEAELIASVAEMFSAVGLNKTELQINCLGDTESRAAFRTALKKFLEPLSAQLDADSQRRLLTNPLRILDSKDANTQAIVKEAPSLADFLSESSRIHFEQLQAYLQALNIEFTVNPYLVRGLDYYNDTVFEWVNKDFGAQATVCAGGRYDGLVEQIGGAATPAFGFAMGMERLVQILQEQGAPIAEPQNRPEIYLISIGEQARMQALALQQVLCAAEVKVVTHCGSGSMKNQFKRADKSGAGLALIIGEDEAQQEQVTLKILDRSAAAQAQQTIAQSDALNAVTNCLESL